MISIYQHKTVVVVCVGERHTLQQEWAAAVEQENPGLFDQGFVNTRWSFPDEHVYTGNTASPYGLAVALWRWYHRYCDAYDDVVCTGKGRGGVSLPATGYQRRLVSGNARDASQAIHWIAKHCRIDGETWRQGMQFALRELTHADSVRQARSGQPC